MTPELTALVENWYASGTPDLGVLAATICARAQLDTVDGVNVRFAAGADGAEDLRIEVTPIAKVEYVEDGKKTIRVVSGLGAPEVDRWRPSAGSLDAVVGSRAAAPTSKALASALTLDVTQVELLDTHAALSALKARRNQLLDMQEAGADAAAELSAVDAKNAEIRKEHDVLNLKSKAVLVAADIASLTEKLAQVTDPIEVADLESARTQRATLAAEIAAKIAVARDQAEADTEARRGS